MVLFHSVLNVCTLALLLLFAFQYQMMRNSEVADARYALASYLFASGDRSHAFLNRRIETIDEFVNILERTVRAYYAVPTRSRGLFMHYTGSDGNVVAAPELFVQYRDRDSGSPAFARIFTATYQLTLADPIGPFANASALLRNYSESCAPQVDLVAGGTFIPCRVSTIGSLLDRVVQLRLSFSLFSRRRWWPGGAAVDAVPSTWDVIVEYGFEGHKAVMKMVTRLSSVSRRMREQEWLLICWLIALAALVDLYWRLRTELKDAAAAAGKHPPRKERPGSLSTGSSSSSTASRAAPGTTEVKENGWRWLGYLSNAVVLAFAATALVAQHRVQTGDLLEEAVTLLLAFAALLSSFRVVVLLKLFPAWYVLIDGLATALEQLFVLAVGVVPVLLGFAVCGTAVFGGFGNGTSFHSVPAAVVTMLCSMFGDNLFDTFLDMDQSPYQLQIFFARLFFITFMALFVCNILNIAHSIIQDSYSQALKSYASTLTAKEAARAAQSASSTTFPLLPPQQFDDGYGGKDNDNDDENDNDTVAKEGSAGDSCETKRQYGRDEDACVCSAASASASASHSSGDGDLCCSTCGLPKQPKQPPRLLPANVRGPLRAVEVEQMLLRLDKIAQ